MSTDELLIEKRATKGPPTTTGIPTLPGHSRAGSVREWPTDPGQGGRCVVIDDGARLLVQAAESVVSPPGWDGDDVRDHLRETRFASLAAYR